MELEAVRILLNDNATLAIAISAILASLIAAFVLYRKSSVKRASDNNSVWEDEISSSRGKSKEAGNKKNKQKKVKSANATSNAAEVVKTSVKKQDKSTPVAQLNINKTTKAHDSTTAAKHKGGKKLNNSANKSMEEKMDGANISGEWTVAVGKKKQKSGGGGVKREEEETVGGGSVVGVESLDTSASAAASVGVTAADNAVATGGVKAPTAATNKKKQQSAIAVATDDDFDAPAAAVTATASKKSHTAADTATANKKPQAAQDNTKGVTEDISAADIPKVSPLKASVHETSSSSAVTPKVSPNKISARETSPSTDDALPVADDFVSSNGKKKKSKKKGKENLEIGSDVSQVVESERDREVNHVGEAAVDERLVLQEAIANATATANNAPVFAAVDAALPTKSGAKKNKSKNKNKSGTTREPTDESPLPLVSHTHHEPTSIAVPAVKSSVLSSSSGIETHSLPVLLPTVTDVPLERGAGSANHLSGAVVQSVDGVKASTVVVFDELGDTSSSDVTIKKKKKARKDL